MAIVDRDCCGAYSIGTIGIIAACLLPRRLPLISCTIA